ncbi:hypothetical protein TrCOL_g6251 [Triparma columacea]|uniref:Uncharacterized protein n=1 Tax=Triparma columacea TaxID=722753 RepID=A0A9W7G3T1_9STRA|nr:hypothetical protein TrCOL_g6251 [Triparma columacea]
MEDKLRSTRKIYSAAGRELGSSALREMKEHLDTNAQHKHGRAEYGLEKFGLSERRVGEVMKDYKEEFGV